MLLNVSYPLLPKQRTTATCQVMDHFGIDFETGSHPIANDFELPLQAGQIVCFTGDSGAGKSSLMRAASQQLTNVLTVESLELGNKSLVDLLPGSLEQNLRWLSACGLSEAQLLLRTPAELSDGQRYRFRLALALSRQPQWMMADEFTATLDRTLARAMAFNLRRICDQTGIGFLLATTQTDLLTDLAPDLHVECRLGSSPLLHENQRRHKNQNQKTIATIANHTSPVEKADPVEKTGKKKESSVLRTNSGSVPAPSPTGRISHGGIIAHIRSGWSNS